MRGMGRGAMAREYREAPSGARFGKPDSAKGQQGKREQGNFRRMKEETRGGHGPKAYQQGEGSRTQRTYQQGKGAAAPKHTSRPKGAAAPKNTSNLEEAAALRHGKGSEGEVPEGRSRERGPRRRSISSVRSLQNAAAVDGSTLATRNSWRQRPPASGGRWSLTASRSP